MPTKRIPLTQLHRNQRTTVLDVESGDHAIITDYGTEILAMVDITWYRLATEALAKQGVKEIRG